MYSTIGLFQNLKAHPLKVKVTKNRRKKKEKKKKKRERDGPFLTGYCLLNIQTFGHKDKKFY